MPVVFKEVVFLFYISNNITWEFANYDLISLI